VAYLTELVKHLMYTLEERLGSAILQTIPLEFVLTVPAIWSESAKLKTLAACQRAGIKSQSDILLVSEPVSKANIVFLFLLIARKEAAAIYALHGLDPHGLDVGDNFVLCDAGGGTVDLISYTIIELYPTLRVEEAAPGSGGLCGSTFLNRKFAEYLVTKLKQPIIDDEETFAEAMQTFDTVVSLETGRDGIS
jgi:molecular chaperone DnaK (HSP70)